ncbi:MAG TPA: ATP synthase subunit C [Spirochaetia bacterium]|nr:ATP synthase subunit C [Spirochaetia bacterium]
MKKRTLVTLALMLVGAAPVLFAQAAPAAAPAVSGAALKYIAAALAVGMATLGAGVAVGQIGASALAAMSENPDLGGRALPFVGLAEGIALWGFIVALMILSA